MAIDLHKEEYHKEQSSENDKQAPPIREVFPTYNEPPYTGGIVGEDGEIYPVREMYPKASDKLPEDNAPKEQPAPTEQPAPKDMTGRFLENRIYIRKTWKIVLVLAAVALLTVLISFSIVYNMGQWNFWQIR